MNNGDEDNESAFPKLMSEGIESGRVSELACVWFEGGLTKRELFSAMAMQGMLSAGPHRSEADSSIEGKVRHAVKLADALLKELKTRKE